MKILLLSRYDRRGASSRIRSFQYLVQLQRAGIAIEVDSLLDSNYLRGRYRRGRTPIAIKPVLSYFRRAYKLLAGDFNLIWVEKEAFPWVPWWLERLLMRTAPIVADYDDALFHRYDAHNSRLVRLFLGKKIDRVMGEASVVTVGNSYLAARAKAAGGQRIEVLPSSVDLSRYTPVRPIDQTRFVIGWIGTPVTFSYVQHIKDTLVDFCLTSGSQILLIGANLDISWPADIAEFVPWTESNEVSEIERCNVGIMPLPDTEWTRGKCGYKLIQYMAAARPVIASPVGINRDIVESGINGFLASTPLDWKLHLETLFSSAVLQSQLGAAGRLLVEREFNTERTGERLELILRTAGRKGPRHTSSKEPS